MNLVIDFGNTTGKAALFENNKLLDLIKTSELNEVVAFSKNYHVENCLISSSGMEPQIIQEAINIPSKVLNVQMKFPFKIAYKTPETLGLDRIAAVAGAYEMFAGQNILVIDAGTCITYDVLISNEYLGGAISPGINMRFKSLNTFTANLPLVELSDFNHLTGDSTLNSILSGVLNGIRAEVDEMINSFVNKYGSLQVVICGGDYIFFENKLKASIFAAPELVLSGLNGILRYNA